MRAGCPLEARPMETRHPIKQYGGGSGCEDEEEVDVKMSAKPIRSTSAQTAVWEQLKYIFYRGVGTTQIYILRRPCQKLLICLI
jgi:hypothetical protein